MSLPRENTILNVQYYLSFFFLCIMYFPANNLQIYFDFSSCLSLLPALHIFMFLIIFPLISKMWQMKASGLDQTPRLPSSSLNANS